MVTRCARICDDELCWNGEPSPDSKDKRTVARLPPSQCSLAIWAFVLLAGLPVASARHDVEKPHHEHSVATYVWEWIAVAVLVLISGLSAGLTLGLMSLDETQLYVLSQSGSPQQRMYAEKIMPIRRNGHLLLVSLLLLNVVVNETLPIISEDALGSGVFSIVVSTILIVIFSEILPQAICSRHGLAVGAFLAVPVRVIIWIEFVVAYPIALLLDWMLGRSHGLIYRRAELKELIGFHAQQQHHGGDLNVDAVTIIRGALDLQEKVVKDAMTDINDAFCLPIDCRLDRACIERIVETGHSRIPVYEHVEGKPAFRRIIGCLLAKSLILIQPDDALPLSDVPIIKMPYVQDDMPLFDILNSFQEGNSHMAIVVPAPPPHDESTDESESGVESGVESGDESWPILPADAIPADGSAAVKMHHIWSDEAMEQLPPVGIITLEDVLEELIQEPIWDESDVHGSEADPEAPTIKPRAGLAIPLETGERVILATDRGRQQIRAPRRVRSTHAFGSEKQGERSDSGVRSVARSATPKRSVSRTDSPDVSDAAEKLDAVRSDDAGVESSLTDPRVERILNQQLQGPTSLPASPRFGPFNRGPSPAGAGRNRFKSITSLSSLAKAKD